VLNKYDAISGPKQLDLSQRHSRLIAMKQTFHGLSQVAVVPCFVGASQMVGLEKKISQTHFIPQLLNAST
jgi:hypothetical protein